MLKESGAAVCSTDSVSELFNCLGITVEHKVRGIIKVKVKVTFVQALRLCTGRTARRGSRDIALPLHDRGTRRR